MQTITDHTDGDLIVKQDTVLNGFVDGSVIVRPKKVLTVNGVVTGNLVIEWAARVEMNGIVSGDVYNQGGVFNRTGIIAGTIVGDKQTNKYQRTKK